MMKSMVEVCPEKTSSDRRTRFAESGSFIWQLVDFLHGVLRVFGDNCLFLVRIRVGKCLPFSGDLRTREVSFMSELSFNLICTAFKTFCLLLRNGIKLSLFNFRVLASFH